jgi:N12 class adenine-specific DNA methylase
MSEQEPQEQPGILERTWESAKAVGEGLTFLPGGIVDTVQDVVSGFDPTDKEEMAQRAQTQRELEAYHKKYAGKAFGGVTEAMSSIPYSLTTMGAGLAGGAAGGLLSGGNPVVAGGAGMAASGKTAYEASVAQFNRTLYDASTQVLKREPTPDEWGKIQGYFADKATEYGLWEAGPEAISNLLMTKLLGPLGSKVKGGIKGAFKSILGLYGEELGTETITQMGQGGIEADMGLRDKAPGPIDAFFEVAPATIAQTTLFAGGKKGIDLAFRRTLAGRNSGQEGNIQQSGGGTTVPPTIENPQPSTQQAASNMEQPTPNGGQRPQAEDFGLSGVFGGQSYQDVLRRQQPQGAPTDRIKPVDPFDDGYDETAEWVRQNEQRVGGDDQHAVSDLWDMTKGPSISFGKTVDLIVGDYGENAPAVRQPSTMYGMNFLNQNPGHMDAIDVPYTVIPMSNAPQARPVGGNARIPLMAGNAVSQSAYDRTLVTPYNAPSGPAISMPSTAPAQGVVGGLSSPVAQPAGGVPMQAPRGDTTAQAEGLGMRAPDTVPEDFLRSHIIVGAVPSPAPASRSERHPSVPSVVPSPAGMAAGQQNAGQVPAVQEQARKRLEGMTRRELLALVPEKELPAARKEKNKNSLIERILASEFAAGTGESSLSGERRGVDSGQKEEGHAGLQQGTPGTGTGELLSESVPVDAAGNPGELAAAARGSGRYHGDLGNRPDLDTALPGVDGREAGLGAAVQRTAGSVEVPGEGRGQNVSFNQIPTIPDSGRSASGRGDEPAFRGLPEVGRDVSGGSKGTKNASFEKNGRKGIERKLLRAIERQQGGVSPEAEAWAHGLNPQERKKAYEQLVLNEFKRHTASELGVDEESLRFIPVRKDSETSLRLKEIGGVFGQDVVIFKDSSSVQTGIRGASVPTIEHVVFMEGSAEREKPYLFVLGHELLHRMRSEDLKAYKQFQEYLLDDLQEDAIPRYRENLDRRTGGDGTVARMSDEAILEEIGADLVGKRLTEESFWAKMADERPSLFARVAQLVRDLLDRVTAAFRADPLPAAWVKDFDAIRGHIDTMMGRWAEKNAWRQQRENTDRTLSGATSPVVESKKMQEGEHGETDDRGGNGPAELPVVEDASHMASGQRSGAGNGAVGDAGAQGTSGSPRQNGVRHDADSPRDGRHAGGREGGNDRDGAVPSGHDRSGRGDAGGAEGSNSGLGGRAGKLSADGGRGRKNSRNHRVGPDDVLVPGGNVTRAKANIEAVRILKKLNEEKRDATPEEKKRLAQFTGWGSLAQEVFNTEYAYAAQYEKRFDGGLPPALRYADDKKRSDYARWKKNYGTALHPDLGGMMTAQEWDAAEKSTLNAHYTDRKVIGAMWGMAEKLGFRGGRVLEPSAGTGLFFGLMPESLSGRSSLVGVELDTLTGGILGKLYPDADIQVTGFENAKRVGDNTLDLVISNVPFGNFRVTDKKRPQYARQSIHNYFISRSIDAARPGGLVMEITSHFTMDSVSGASIREEWGRKADLVAAVRLPGTAFEKNAGTQVTTDILIFRKKDSGLSPVSNAFRNVENVETPDGPAVVNEYFVQHPEMVLGEHSLQGSMYGENEYTLKPKDGESIEDGLKKALDALPANVFGEGRAVPVEREERIADAGMREGALVEKDGGLFTVSDGALVKPEWDDKPKKVRQAASYVGVKKSVFDLINAMNSDADDAGIGKLRDALNSAYDAYVKDYGPINKDGNGFLEDDIEFPTVAAIERLVSVPVTKTYKSGKRKGESYQVDEKRVAKADIFTKRTIFPFKEPTSAENIQDAIKICRIFRTGIDVGYIGNLLGMSPEAARAELLKTETLFENPETGLIEPDDIYLSGNVRKKLEMAEAGREDNPAYEKNVEALRKVQPERIGIDAIHARIGSSWVPAKVYEAFVKHLGFSSASVEKARLEGEDGSTQWHVEAYGGTPEARNRWGVDGASVIDLISDSLNLKRTEVYDEHYNADGKTSRVKNTEKTLAAQEKQRSIQNEFQSWLKKDDDAGRLVEDEYNGRFNGFVPRKFTAPDIKHFPGASHSIELRENQKIGVVRGLQESTLLAHGVGSGKTMLQITLAMEMRRLGTAKKPWIVVQASTLSQFAATFKTLYPRAAILAPTEKQRNAKNRQRLLAQIASGDWDAVVTPHGFFNSISIDPENEARFIETQIEEYKDSLRNDFEVDDIDKKKSSESRTVKQIRKKIEKLKNRLEALSNTKKDENIYFEQLGVDALIIDEAHVYKRGSFYTKMDNVKGLDRDSSQRSMQMLMKARHVQAKTGGKNVVLATGTPISNTLTEMWTMFRYTRPDLLKEFGVEQFDDFASAFADTSIDLEETATGEFKQVERFNKFVNGPELLTLWRSGADVALTEDLDYIKGLPKLKEGRIHEVVVERSESLSNYIEALRQERAEWDRLSGKEKSDPKNRSVPLQIYGKAKKAAIDLRLVDSSLPDEPVSKANRAVENIYDRWEENRDNKAAQIVFCDNFKSGDGKFNLFEDIRDKLIARGVPKEDVAVIHDFKTDEARKRLFDAVNRGDVRVLMGTTEKLGVGVNVQERLLTAHHLDAPPRPMDFEQRNGRIRRPGNMFSEVEVLTYGTRNTLDSVTFQQLISKQKFINQLLRGDVGTRSFENPFDATQATFEDMMAAFSGNPLAKEKMQLQVEVRRLEALNAAYESRLGTLRYNLRSAKSNLDFLEGRTKSAEAVTAFVNEHFPDGEIEGRKELSKDVSAWLDGELKRIEKVLSGIRKYAQWQVKNPRDYAAGMTVELGNGVSAEVSVLPHVAEAGGELSKGVAMSYQLAGPHGIKESGPFNGAAGLFTRLKNDLARYAGSAAENAAKIKGAKAQIASLEEELKRPFEQKKELEDARERMLEIEQKLAETSKKPDTEEAPMASVNPGEFLNEVPASRLRVRKAAVQSVADALGKRAANAADTRVVQSFEELPEHIRQLYGEVSSRLEGVYDPASGTVYLVADNLRGTARAAEVWMHENMVHHGLNGLLGKDEKRRVLNRLWQGMGGMGNAEIASVAQKYGVDPRSDAEGRALVMEEVVAHLAEKRAAYKLSGQELTYWRRVVEAVLRAWHALVDAVTGRTGSMKYENVDRLLSALDRYVFEGRPESMAEGGMVPAMASKRSDPNNARFSPDTGKKTDFVTLPDGSVDFAQFPATRLKDMRLLRAAPIRLPRGIHSLSGGYGLTHIEANHGNEIRAAGYGSVQEFVWDLVNGYNEIWEGEKRSLLILKNNGKTSRPAGFIELEKDGSHYIVKNAYPVDMNYPTAATRKQLWKSAPPSSSTSGEQTPSNPFTPGIPSKDQTGNLQGQRGQSSKENIQQGRVEDKPLASLRDIKDVRDITGMSAEDAMNLAKNDPWIGSIFGKSDDVTLMQRIFMLPHWVAKRFPGFKAVYDRQVRRQDERAAERARSLQEIPSLFGENKLSGKDMGELKKLVWDNDGKQIAELEGIDKFLTDEELESGRTTIKANPEWYEGYDKWLSRQPGSDAVKKAMREIRVSLDNDLMRAHNRLARMSEMGDVAIQEFRTQIGHIHNYFPHHRYGDYFIQGKDKKGEVVYREHFDALHKRYARRHFEKRLEALKKEYPDTVFDLGENTKLPDEAFGRRVLDPEAMEQVIDAALSKVADKEQAKKIAEVLHESVADVMKSSGWGAHAIGRKNIPGFEKDDLFRVLYDYKSGLTGWLTKMEASKDFVEALGKIKAKAHPQEWSYTSQYVKDMLRNGDRVDRTVGTIKSAAFAWYLGGNIKTAVLNLTQNVIVGVPRLQMDVEGGARAYIDGAQKQIVNQYARRFTGDKGKGLSEEEARLIQDLYGDALITDAYMEEVRGQVTGGPSTRLWNKLMKVMGYPMSVAERFNRGSLALAAFRAARDGKMKAAARKRYGVEGEKATYEQAKAFAEEIVRDSHFVYGKTNAPELLRSSTAGRGLGAAFTFKTFTANLLGLWSWALRTQGKEGRIMVAKGLASTIALGGLVSTPFYATVMALVQAVSGDDDDWTEAIRKQLPQNTMLRDIVCYGLPAGAGVNLGGSLKMELALTGGMQKGGTPKEVLTEGIGDIIGIPWDMFVERPSKVMEAMRADNYWRAVEEVVPTAVSNGMKAWRLATEGQKTLKGRDINDPGEQGARKLSSGEAFGKLLGFQPVSATRSYDAYTASKHSDSVRADKADEVATIMVKALDAGDSAEMVRARKVLKDWNLKMEEEGKPHMRILMKDVQKRITQRRRKARMTPKARQRGEAFQSVWG